MVISASQESQTVAAKTEIVFAKCDCCALTEECTTAYIERVRERYEGRWICGLCSEAVKYEMVKTGRMISSEEALKRHMNFFTNFRSSVPPVDSTVHLISAVRQILRRSSESSPRRLRSTPSSPTRNDPSIPLSRLSRSESCFPNLSGS